MTSLAISGTIVQMISRPTIGDIARTAGVSSATVSRVLNNPEKVHNRTRDIVYSAMKELNYIPSGSSGTQNDISGIIALFAPNLLLESVAEMVRAVENELRGTAFDLLLVNMHGEREFAEFITIKNNLRNKIDGAIVFSAEVDQRASELMAASNIPIVLVQARSSVVRSISNNNFLGGHDATEYLLKKGHRRIAFVGWEPQDDHISERMDGYRSALQRSGLESTDVLASFGPLTTDGGYEATRKLLERLKPEFPEAIFFATDVLVVGGLRYFREQGISVPEDISVIGYDDLAVAEAMGLTTMRQYFDTKARMVVGYLTKRISGEIREAQVEELQITPRLVERQTVSNSVVDGD